MDLNCGDEVGSPHRQRLDAFVTKNYDRLGYICKKHGRAKGQDILDYVIDQLYSDRGSIVSLLERPEGEVLAWCTQVAKNSAKGTYGFGRAQRKYCEVHREESEGPDESQDRLGLVPESFDEQPEMRLTRSFYEEELILDGFTPEQADKLARLQAAVARLPIGYKRLYNLVFVDCLTYTQVSEIVKIPRTSVFLLVSDLRRMLVEHVEQKIEPLL